LTKKIGQLENSNSNLSMKIEQLESSNNQLSEQILQLETTQTKNLNELTTSYQNFLKKLADTLNSKGSSNLETTLQSQYGSDN
jgi:chromosome segregation ATPase